MESIITRLREHARWLETRSFAYLDGSLEWDAADILEFIFEQLQSHSIKMDGQHSYRLRGGWPMTHAKGLTPEIAILNAMKEVEKNGRHDTG